MPKAGWLFFFSCSNVDYFVLALRKSFGQYKTTDFNFTCIVHASLRAMWFSNKLQDKTKLEKLLKKSLFQACAKFARSNRCQFCLLEQSIQTTKNHKPPRKINCNSSFRLHLLVPYLSCECQTAPVDWMSKPAEGSISDTVSTTCLDIRTHFCLMPWVWAAQGHTTLFLLMPLCTL